MPKKKPPVRARSAVKGTFVTMEEAKKHPNETVVEKIKPRKK